MTWTWIAYFVGLLYLTTHREKLADTTSLRPAWIWFAFIPICQSFFTLFRAGNFSNPKSLALVEIWADGFGWLLLGVSLLCLTNCLTGSQAASPQATAGPVGPAQPE